MSVSKLASQSVNLRKTTCSLCPAVVLISNEDNRRNSLKKRSKLVQNLCLVMELSRDGLPDRCGVAQFPFCPSCFGLVARLHHLQNVHMAMVYTNLRCNVAVLMARVSRNQQGDSTQGAQAADFLEGNVLRKKLLEGECATWL